MDIKELQVDLLKVNPDKLTIEFTESAYFQSDVYQESVISAIREAGAQIAVDDFGTGSTSFEYLNRSYFDVLKIDRMFISGITQTSRQYQIVRSIINLSKTLGLRTVADGVETLEEYQILDDLGVNYIQGYLFSKPMSIVELRKVEDYCVLPDIERTELTSDLMSDLMLPTSYPINPAALLSEVHQVFKDNDIDVLPVIDQSKCVGFIDKKAMNLHLTPAMGIDI